MPKNTHRLTRDNLLRTCGFRLSFFDNWVSSSTRWEQGPNCQTRAWFSIVMGSPPARNMGFLQREKRRICVLEEEVLFDLSISVSASEVTDQKLFACRQDFWPKQAVTYKVCLTFCRSGVKRYKPNMLSNSNVRIDRIGPRGCVRRQPVDERRVQLILGVCASAKERDSPESFNLGFVTTDCSFFSRRLVTGPLCWRLPHS